MHNCPLHGKQKVVRLQLVRSVIRFALSAFLIIIYSVLFVFAETDLAENKPPIFVNAGSLYLTNILVS